jgi:predicted pyridoxine 5'-phosphate oxidase superfamily flavin-nucleotide-binding protein
MYKPVKNMGDRFPVKALVVMKITEIYGCKPGEQSPERNCFDPVQSLIHKLANK